MAGVGFPSLSGHAFTPGMEYTMAAGVFMLEFIFGLLFAGLVGYWYLTDNVDRNA